MCGPGVFGMEVKEHPGGGQFYMFGQPFGPKFGADSGAKSGTKSGTRQTSASSPKGADRRGNLIGGGSNEGNLGRKTLLGG